MTTQNTLELKGDFLSYPFAELIVEIIQARLSGSLRVSSEKTKVIIYFRDGSVVYAASNAREQRLFSLLLGRKKIDQKTLARVPNFANDVELAAELKNKAIFTKAEIDDFVSIQIESIIVSVLTWTRGQWLFNPLARLREDLIYQTDVHKILVNYARCLPSEAVYSRFNSVEEAFQRNESPTTGAILQPHETYALDLFTSGKMTIEDLRPRCSLPETAMFQTLYVLWLGGFLIRRDWNAAFNATKVGEILSAKVSLVKQATTFAKPEPKKDEPEIKVPVEEAAAKLPEIHISLEDYLNRVENAGTLYDVLGIASDADLAEIKHSYFAMAKSFHPDRFHREDAADLRRIQKAFTELAHAYETLKTDESRQSYNFKMHKELEAREKRKASAAADGVAVGDRQAESGLESFEKGLEALADEEYAAAAGHLSRAVHYRPQNALYHAYFGQALSKLQKQHHKAEASLQTAVRLDPGNPQIRMMLVDFFTEMKMLKRAEGELKRFLEIAPGNKEAAKMLADLQRSSPVRA